MFAVAAPLRLYTFKCPIEHLRDAQMLIETMCTNGTSVGFALVAEDNFDEMALNVFVGCPTYLKTFLH